MLNDIQTEILRGSIAVISENGHICNPPGYYSRVQVSVVGIGGKFMKTLNSDSGEMVLFVE